MRSLTQRSPLTLRRLAAVALVITLPLLAKQLWLGRAIPTGSRGGLQAGSPWPMLHADLRHSGSSSRVGSQTGRLRWKRNLSLPTFEGWLTGGPVLGADGTLYVSQSTQLRAISA